MASTAPGPAPDDPALNGPAPGERPPGGRVLFEAVITPPRSFTPRGYRVLAGLLLVPATASSALFLSLGAWPVFGFLGGGLALALGLVALHHRRSARAVELVVLTETVLTVSRTDARGRRERASLQPYWTRLDLREWPGSAPGLWLVERNRMVEIGRDLAETEKRDLRAALGAALRRYREPVFDNPQLRDG
jgi:uncharacterized membrane protein